MGTGKMKNLIRVTTIFTLISLSAAAQEEKAADSALKIYREAAPKINDLVHTKLDVRFDYKKRYLYGKEWVTLRPHFYATDSLRLDAQGMDINSVAIVHGSSSKPLSFIYADGKSIAIHLDKVYKRTENYTIYISYTSKPDELKVKGSAAITDAKGLYFINPDSAVKGKPVQIWTQGEPESSSAWFPTIDKPDQKTTEEISMTVPEKYVTLSNGRLAAQKNNGDGTRTDTWKMDLPHAPYLFMMAVGDFRIYHDKWRNKEVNYYLEPAYAPYAKEIFGFTPEVIEFYSNILGVDFPWNKYSQIVVRDYVSGAMENTTATLHGEYVQQTPGELKDAYYSFGRSTIVHELFHQWFGDYVTCESWSNITVNESFANFSETLWAEHKYGKEEGDFNNYSDMLEYLRSPDAKAKDLLRFHYIDLMDVFDVVSYQKGGRILYMLRNYLGDSCFFKGLQIYLKTNAFKTGEAHQLRLAFEEASGLDLNWFFNQWYYGSGHPELNIHYLWNETAKTEMVYLEQTQSGQIFKLPMAMDIYSGGTKVRHNVWMNNKTDTFTFPLDSKPELVNVDGDKVLLSQKTDNKTLTEFEFQYFHAPLYVDRYEALEAADSDKNNKIAQHIILTALQDKSYHLRIRAIKSIDIRNLQLTGEAIPVLISLIQKDSITLVQAAAINKLAKLKDSSYLGLYRKAFDNESYAVKGEALAAIGSLNNAEGMRLAKGLKDDEIKPLTPALIKLYAQNGDAANWPFVYTHYLDLTAQTKYNLSETFANFAGTVDNPQYSQQGIEALKAFGIKYKTFIGPAIIARLNSIKAQRVKLNDAVSAAAADRAVQEINDAK